MPFDSSVTRPAVLDRDNWVCQICGIGVVDGGDTTVDNYAEVDHIIPLSARILGHTWDNVQLLCRKCNAEKLATIPGDWADQHPLWMTVEVYA